MVLNHMEITTRPLFVLYVVWHPSYANGDEVSDLLRRHFGDDRYRNVAGGSGLSVYDALKRDIFDPQRDS